ncbi:MAG: NUDIX domain-containing protein [Alphaproteobacteria bacterium]|nr:MAG: NUDIX domain-containing protein [Alphaproteobacteria bacterium]
MTTPGSRPSGPQSPPQFVRAVPEGDDRPRLMCTRCGFVRYENPKVVVGTVAAWNDGRILLCRRAIEPRPGLWTLPAGYLELHETAVEGAQREAWEEARARIDIDQLLAVYSIPRLSQIQLIYRARLLSPDVSPGSETSETGLFEWDRIPWSQIAFPSVVWALNHYRERLGQSGFAPFANPPGETGEIP